MKLPQKKMQNRLIKIANDTNTFLKSFIKKQIPSIDKKDENFMCEFLLWGLSSYKKVNITRTSRGLSFSDSFSDYINGL